MKCKLVFLVSLLLVLVFTSVVVAQEGEPPPEVTGIPVIDEFLAAGGVGVLILLVVEFLKRIGKIPDGYAGKIVVILGLVAFVGLTIAGMFGFDISGETPQLVIEVLVQIAKLATIIISSIGVFKALRAGGVLKPLPGRA